MKAKAQTIHSPASGGRHNKLTLTALAAIGLLSFSTYAKAASFEQTFEDGPRQWPYSVVAWFTEPLPAVQPNGPSGDFMRLAYNEVPNQVNGIALDPIAGDVNHLSFTFDFRMGGGNPFNDPQLGADGMGLVLLNTEVPGFDESGVVPWPWWDPSGLPEEPNVPGSIGVGLDTWQNVDLGDPSNDHISLHFDGHLLSTFDLSQTPLNLEDNQWHSAFLSVNFLSQLVLFMIDGQLYFKQSIPGLKPYPIRPAFYARTGPDYFNNHDLDNIRATVGVAGPQPGK